MILRSFWVPAARPPPIDIALPDQATADRYKSKVHLWNRLNSSSRIAESLNSERYIFTNDYIQLNLSNQMLARSN